MAEANSRRLSLSIQSPVANVDLKRSVESPSGVAVQPTDASRSRKSILVGVLIGVLLLGGIGVDVSALIKVLTSNL